MVRRFTSILVHAADSGQHTELTLQSTLHRDYMLRFFIENNELELHTQDNRIWTPAQRPYVHCFPLRTPTDVCACVAVFLRHPRYARRFICVVNSLGRKTDRRAACSIFKRFLMIIGSRMGTSSRYRVSHEHPRNRLYLIATHRGHYSRRKASPVSLVFRITVLY